jgi:molybdopterin/thiamine biosynthesis adenylyltransferase
MSGRPAFSYDELVTRNAGFLSPAEQATLRSGRVFVCGVGGMGGAALQSLVRAGVGRFALADMDTFEVSNLNRQLFATLDTVGQPKVAATAAAIARINPDIELATFGAEWVERLDEILPVYQTIINGMDDLAAGIALYRKAREHGATVIDAYTAPLPSVTVVRPTDPRPEERLGYPTLDTDWRAITPAQAAACKAAEALYVAVHSSSASYIDHSVAAAMFAGTRARPSFAPMVIETGTLMAFEAVKLLLGRPSGVDHRGVFLDPWTMRVERPKSAPVAWLRARVARRLLARLTA